MTPYELETLSKIATRQVRPTAVHSLLEKIGNPLGRLLNSGSRSRNDLARRTAERAARWIELGLIRTFHVGSRFREDATTVSRFRRYGVELRDLEGARKLPLECLDHVADTFKLRGTVLLGAEGAVLGAATSMAYVLPGSQLLVPSLAFADLAGSLALLSRQTCRVASAYGFSPADPVNMPHLIAAMAPPSQDAGEGYIAVKAAAFSAVGDAQRFVRAGSGRISRNLLERDAPRLIRLIAYVARRMGVVISEKNLAVLVPLAGVVLNSTVNAAFHRTGHSMAKDYFRRLILDERYGTEVVESTLAAELMESTSGALD